MLSVVRTGTSEEDTYIECVGHGGLGGDVSPVAKFGLDMIGVHIVTSTRRDPLQPNSGMVERIDIVITILSALFNAGDAVFF